MKGFAAGITLIAAWASAIVAGRAECIGVSVPDAKRAAVFVFEGTITKVEQLKYPEFASTLNVSRVWKGDVPKKVTVYYESTFDGPTLNEGERVIIFAVRQTPTMRKKLGITDDSPVREVWVPPCSGAWRPDDSVIRALGPARGPNESGERQRQ